MSIASGTLIQVGRRLLVATAAHCIPTNPSGRIWILPNDRCRPQDGMLAILTHGEDNQTDVGFMELKPESAKAYLNQHTACDLACLAPAGPGGAANTLAVLVGSPAARIAKGLHETGVPEFQARVDGYVSSFLSPETWPETPDSDRPKCEAIDMFMEYPEEVRPSVTLQVISSEMRAKHGRADGLVGFRGVERV